MVTVIVVNNTVISWNFAKLAVNIIQFGDMFCYHYFIHEKGIVVWVKTEDIGAVKRAVLFDLKPFIMFMLVRKSVGVVFYHNMKN